MPISSIKDARLRRQAAIELAKLKARAGRLRTQRSNLKLELEARLADVWGSPFETFNHMLLECRLLLERVQKASAKTSPVATRKMHIGLFGRSLLTASEVLELLTSGHGHGAYTRWRTLFELSAFAEFIKSHGDEAAERYVNYYTIETLRYVQARWPDFTKLPLESTKVFEQMRADRERLKTLYGKEFLEDHGWASKWIIGRVTIQKIVEAANLGRVKAEYKSASYYVHAGGMGSLDNVQFMAKGHRLLSAANDELISRPGRLSVISLALHCSMLVQACRATSCEKTVFAIGALARETEDGFIASHARWVEETGRDELEWQR